MEKRYIIYRTKVRIMAVSSSETMEVRRQSSAIFAMLSFKKTEHLNPNSIPSKNIFEK